jgi:hypothetical protein
MTEDPQDVAIEPDTKDWTWVLERPCPECGFAAAELAPTDIPARVDDAAGRWRAVLARPEVRLRPAPDVWSPLEYACHVRDVLTVFADRATAIRTQDGPTFANWDQDATAVAERYGEQDPALVAEQLAAAADRARAAFSDVPPGGWDRPGLRSNGSRFTLATLGQYFVHDVVHHLWDVEG